MKTVKDVFDTYKETLKLLYEKNEAEAITLLVISEVCNLSKAKIKAFPEMEITAGQTLKLTDILDQLKTGKPVQYILGRTEFYGLPFIVNPAVLIPRPETEELVEWIISVCRDNKQNTANHILDIGTGSGCIAISIKKNLPAFKVSAIDISADALDTAKENARLNEVEVDFIYADILKPEYVAAQPEFRIIVSNPPYVTLHDKVQMHVNVNDFEPHTALFVPEDDPLIFYKAIADFASKNLVTGGLLFFEINESFGPQTVELLAHKGFKNIELRQDMSGRDRMIKADR